MISVSGVNTGAVRPSTTAGRMPGASRVEKPEEVTQGRPLKPVTDEYVPEEPREPSGRYWMGRDEDGQPKIYFDRPERGDIPAEEIPQQNQGSRGPEKKDGEKEEKYACNTDKVDREIETLKKKRAELERRLNTETDEAKIKDLERQLAQAERELKQKDNDTYRKAHSTFTRLS